MFIPRYWSEASHTERLPDRQQVTIRRFGWSSESQADADVHARQRVEEAAAVLREGGREALEDFTRRERKVAYSGADGLPIREEIVWDWEEGEVVITRNVYGALCMNTTRAMFVDVDQGERKMAGCGCLAFPLGAALGALASLLVLDVSVLTAIVVGAFGLSFLTALIGRIAHRFDRRAHDTLDWALEKTQTWCRENPDWRVVAYETPAGARLLPVHATFDAAEESTFAFMEHVQSDPLYVRMCRLQKCFRARVSPKPWRTGLTERFRAGGTWPVTDADKLATRARWVEGYEEASRDYASCRLVTTIGDGRADAQVEEIRKLHDRMCRAETDLPLA